jgi:MYXO-CTERM domain-containing protein
VSALIPNPPPTPRIDVVSVPPRASALSCLPTVMSAYPKQPSLAPGQPPRAPEPRGTQRRWRVLGAIALAAIAVGVHLGTEAPRKPQIVSGRAGPKVSRSGAAERWWQEQVTVTLDGSLDELSPGARDAVQQAFGAWLSTSAKLPRLTFDTRPSAPVLLEPDGENRIYYAPITMPGHENDLAITLSFTNPDTGEILESDIIVNSKHTWALLPAPGSGPSAGKGAAAPGGDDGKSGASRGDSDRKGQEGKSHGPSAGTPASPTTVVAACNAQYDVESVATHEIGHFFGLGEDMTDPSATMYFSTPPCNVGKRQLQLDDTQEVSTLYSKPAADPSGPAAAGVKSCSVVTLGEGGRAASFATAALVGLVALGRRRRR